jgi:hypothetical protein
LEEVDDALGLGGEVGDVGDCRLRIADCRLGVQQRAERGDADAGGGALKKRAAVDRGDLVEDVFRGSGHVFAATGVR